MKRKTSWRKKFFNWHKWAGLLFSIPVVLVALTAILIAHKDGLGTKNMLVNAGWLPGYQAKQKNIGHLLDDVKAYHVAGEKHYYGTKLGVVAQHNNVLTIVKGTEGSEVRDIAAIGDTLFFASKHGIFSYFEVNNRAMKLINGDFHGLVFNEQKLTALAGKQGLYESTDYGKTWSENMQLSVLLPDVAVARLSERIGNEGYIEKLNWEKLILDIHTGEAFFGSGSMWIWIDLVALSLLVLTCTGIWMWYKRKFRKRAG